MSTVKESPVLAGPIGDCCVTGLQHEGEAVGKTIKIADVDTYVSEPPAGTTDTKIILYFSDVYGPFYPNAKLMQDYYASHGFTVLGLDYFFGDPIYVNYTNPDFDRAAWMAKAKKLAADATPGWIKAVREKYGEDAKYCAVGYCFGGPFVLDLATTDDIVAAAFAHPAFLNEDHFNNVKKPLLMLCAEVDTSFPTPNRRRAEDILVENKQNYHIQVFSGVNHGFATRGDPKVENARWAMEEAACSAIEWCKRFTKSY